MKEDRDHLSYEENLSTYLDGELESSERAELERHLPDCPGCREKLIALRETSVLLKRHMMKPAPPGLATRVLARGEGKPSHFLRSLSWKPALGVLTVALGFFFLYRNRFSKGTPLPSADVSMPYAARLQEKETREDDFSAKPKRMIGMGQRTQTLPGFALGEKQSLPAAPPSEPVAQEEQSARARGIEALREKKTEYKIGEDIRLVGKMPITQESVVLIKDKSVWERFWMSYSDEPVPQIDFKIHMVIVPPAGILLGNVEMLQNKIRIHGWSKYKADANTRYLKIVPASNLPLEYLNK